MYFIPFPHCRATQKCLHFVVYSLQDIVVSAAENTLYLQLKCCYLFLAIFTCSLLPIPRPTEEANRFFSVAQPDTITLFSKCNINPRVTSVTQQTILFILQSCCSSKFTLTSSKTMNKIWLFAVQWDGPLPYLPLSTSFLIYKHVHHNRNQSHFLRRDY